MNTPHSAPPSVAEQPRSRLVTHLLAGAVALGALGSWLLQARGWGIGFSLFMVLACAAVIVAWRVNRVDLTGGGRWLILPLAFFALAYVLRDSDTLRALNLLAAAILLALIVYRARAGQIRVAGISDHAAAGLAAIVVLTLLNPDALIVQVNASRSLLAAPRATPALNPETPGSRNPERPFDAFYAVRLSADAAPALINAMPALECPPK